MENNYPKTIEEIKSADRETICRWWRFLPLNWASEVTNEDFEKAMELNNALSNRFDEVGGFTPSLSKKIGWDN